MEMDGTMRNRILQRERNDHLRASINTLWSQSATEACLWCIPCGNWCRAIPRDEWWDWATHCFCFQDTHKNWARVRANWQRSFGNNLGSQEIPCVFVWPIFHPVYWSSAVNIHLPPTQEHSSGYGSPASALCIILGWIWLPNRVQEH